MKKLRFGYLAYQTKPNQTKPNQTKPNQTSFDCPKTFLSIVKCPQGGGIVAKTYFIDNLPFMCITPSKYTLPNND